MSTLVTDAYTKTYLTLKNTNVYCEYVLNGKPPIVLIHGFLASSYTFHSIMPLLARDFSVIAIDLPGFGNSEKSTKFHYSYENYARLVIACMDYFELGNACLAGHSMGGQIAMYTARITPERINKLVLIGSSAYLWKVYKWARLLSYLPFSHLAAKRLVQKNGVEDTLKNVLHDESHITEDQIETYRKPLKEKNFYKSLIRFLRHREGDLTSEQLRWIHTPALLIWGVNDVVVPLHAGKKLAGDLPNTRFVSYEKTGHLVTEECPEAVYEDIKEWWEK